MKNKIYPPKNDCAFRNKRRLECNILYEMFCVSKGKCSFFKTQEQREEELNKYPSAEDYKLKG